MDVLNLKRIASELTEEVSENEAYFGIFENDEHDADMFIKANENGLKFFIAQMIEAQIDYKKSADEDDQPITIYLDDDLDWMADTYDRQISYIEFVPERFTRDNSDSDSVPKWKTQLSIFGCFALVILGLVSSVIGLIQIIKWMF